MAIDTEAARDTGDAGDQARARADINVVAWRHPRPVGAQGRCIGRTDLHLDHRKAKRLAHRIRDEARRHGWPRVIHTSPLRRCAMVGRQLRRWGWRHRVDASLSEMDFGAWDGQPWQRIGAAALDAWCADFLHGRPGQGESLHAMFERVARGLRADLAVRAAGTAIASVSGGASAASTAPILVVAHAGWMQVVRWLSDGAPLPTDAAHWPAPPAYGDCWRFRLNAGERLAAISPCSSSRAGR